MGSNSGQIALSNFLMRICFLGIGGQNQGNTQHDLIGQKLKTQTPPENQRSGILFCSSFEYHCSRIQLPRWPMPRNRLQNPSKE